MAAPPSPSNDTLSGKSAPHMPGPSIGSIRTTPAPSLTAPDCRHVTSASCRQEARSPKCRKLRPQPASASSSSAPPQIETSPTLHTRENASSFFNEASMLSVREFVKDKESLTARNGTFFFRVRRGTRRRRMRGLSRVCHAGSPAKPGHAAPLPTFCAPPCCSAHRFFLRTIKLLPPPFRPRMTARANFAAVPCNHF